MSEPRLPDLTFKGVQYGKFETAWDLRPFLYRGGARTNAKLVADQISNGVHGHPILERLPLVERIHDYINSKLVGGGSRGTADTTITRLREFYSWADQADRLLDISNAETTFIEWTDHLLHRKRIVGDIKEIHAYQAAVAVAKVLSSVLELRSGLISKSRLRRPSRYRNALGPETDKQNLEQALSFGHALLDITESLTAEAIRGPLPVCIHFRTGQVYEEWLRLKPPEKMKCLSNKARPSTVKSRMAIHQAWQDDKSLQNRFPLTNLRIQAEILVFISQTGMNLEQAHQLRTSKFRYSSHLDGYQVHRVYKGRRQGEVAFEIFSEYREIFERYLAWRREMFPGDEEGLIFPLIGTGRLPGVAPAFTMVQKVCKKLGIAFIGPQALRKTRVNWFLRRSRDASMTAEMHAHTQQTLIRSYEQPSLQVAMAEISRFHAITGSEKPACGPGLCLNSGAEPKAIPFTPANTATPDCINPGGCLFCIHQRDIDSEDHVWSLVSYRYLKSLELSRYRPHADAREPHPAMSAIDRVTAKLHEFEKSSDERASWVVEALSRIEEEHYHSRWNGFIRLMELRS